MNEEYREDRRKKPTPFLSRYTFVGRRRAARRGREKHNYYVDRLGGRVWAIICLITALSVIDSIFTVYFIDKGFTEINPLMNIAIFIGKPVFCVFKYALTAIGILVLAIHKNFRYVKILIAFIVIFYMLLNLYHIYLLANQFPL